MHFAVFFFDLSFLFGKVLVLKLIRLLNLLFPMHRRYERERLRVPFMMLAVSFVSFRAGAARVVGLWAGVERVV